jgi:hypothetical protein
MAWWILPMLFAVLLTAPSVALPGDDLGLRGFQTPPLEPNMRLGQSFVMTADGLHAVEVFPVAAGGRAHGRVRFELYQIENDGREVLMRQAEVPVEDLMRASLYSFEFAPILGSKDRMYRFDLVAAVPERVTFWATHGARYEGGTMHANGRARWADMAFRVQAPAPSVGRRLMTLRETNPLRAYLLIVASLAIWLLLGFVLSAMKAIPDEAALDDPTGQPRNAVSRST